MIESRLDEYDKEEWWDVSRRINPAYTREQYEKDWKEFQLLKAEHLRQRQLS